VTGVRPAEADVLGALVRAEADRTGQEAGCEVLGRRQHRGSVNLEVAFGAGPERRELFVKWLRREAEHRFDRQSSGEGRLRLRPFPDPATKLTHEAVTLSAIERMVEAHRTPGWFSVPVADLSDDGQVLTLGRISLPTLADLAAEPRHSDRVRVAAGNLGAWLRTFHRLDPLPHTVGHLETRDDVAELVAALTEHIRTDGGRDLDRRDAGRAREAVTALPSTLPLVLGHGDLSPLNVLVGAAGEVAVFDTSGDWRMPPHVDMAYFEVMSELSDMKRLAPSRDAKRRRHRADEAFLEGYGQGAPPRRERAVFELVVLLDKWATLSSEMVRLTSVKRRLRKELLVRRIRRAVVARIEEALGD
jgi:hypothetical protein